MGWKKDNPAAISHMNEYREYIENEMADNGIDVACYTENNML
jgi:hypothetical protein